jgi:high-affinity iron transporter
VFEALVITLREGMEAALVLAIALAVLRRRGASHLRGALFAGAALALVLSVVGAVLAMRVTYNEELAEGVAMLVGAVLVGSLVWWMWRAAPHMKEEVESGVMRATAGGVGAAGLFVFAFGMVFREGLETAIFLSAAGLNSRGLSLWLGALLGLGIAAGFGVLFVRGAIRIPLKTFFSFTSAVLLLVALRLFVGGLHELSEAQVLPSSRAEMALIGPIVRSELLLAALTVGLAAAWLVFARRAAPAPAAAAASGPEARLALAERMRDAARRRWTGTLGLVIVGFLLTAFVQSSRAPERPPAETLAAEGGAVSIDAASLADRHARFFETELGAGHARFFALSLNGSVRVCFDACEICGDKGYFEQGGAMVCRNCMSPIVLNSVGRSGGCNPIPLPSREVGGRIVISTADLEAVLPRLQGR